MRLNRSVLLALTAALSLSACGGASTAMQAGLARQSQLEAQSIPPQSAFVTIKVKVTKVLPNDTSGLPHQNFVVEELSPEAGVTLQVNNDTKYGSEVPGLAEGQELTIRGVEYHGGKLNGIHWTHKANKAGDAGFIQTANGKKYE